MCETEVLAIRRDSVDCAMSNFWLQDSSGPTSVSFASCSKLFPTANIGSASYGITDVVVIGAFRGRFSQSRVPNCIRSPTSSFLLVFGDKNADIEDAKSRYEACNWSHEAGIMHSGIVHCEVCNVQSGDNGDIAESSRNGPGTVFFLHFSKMKMRKTAFKNRS